MDIVFEINAFFFQNVNFFNHPLDDIWALIVYNNICR